MNIPFIPLSVIPQLLSGIQDSGIIPIGPGSFKNCLRVDQSLFDEIMEKIGPLIEKKDTNSDLQFPLLRG